MEAEPWPLSPCPERVLALALGVGALPRPVHTLDPLAPALAAGGFSHGVLSFLLLEQAPVLVVFATVWTPAALMQLLAVCRTQRHYVPVGSASPAMVSHLMFLFTHLVSALSQDRQ